MTCMVITVPNDAKMLPKEYSGALSACTAKPAAQPGRVLSHLHRSLKFISAALLLMQLHRGHSHVLQQV